MGVYEVSFFYPDLPFDEHRRFLASVAAGPGSTLQGFRQHGTGIVLTFVITTEQGMDVALQAATQRAAGLWPRLHPTSTNVHVLSVPVAAPDDHHSRPPGTRRIVRSSNPVFDGK